MNDTTSIDTLLDSSLDDLADLPEFGVYPDGSHRVTINWEKKVVNEHPSMELKFKLLETLELADPTATPLSAGAEGSVLFMLDNEFGQGKLKEVLKPLAGAVGETQLSKVIEATQGYELVIVTKARQNKDKSQTFNNIAKVLV